MSLRRRAWRDGFDWKRKYKEFDRGISVGLFCPSVSHGSTIYSRGHQIPDAYMNNNATMQTAMKA